MLFGDRDQGGVRRALAVTASLFLVLGAPLFSAAGASARVVRRPLTLTAPGVSFQKPNTLLVAARLNNVSHRTISGARIDAVRLGTAGVLTHLPLRVGAIAARRSAIVQADFSSAGLVHRKRYLLVVRGSYLTITRKRRAFVSRHLLLLPPAAPARALVETATTAPREVRGAPFPPSPPRFDNEVNGSRWTVPTGKPVPGKRTRTPTSAKKSPLGDPPAISFQVNNGLGISGSTIAEPSGAASAGGVVFASSNWFAAYSTNGGGTFTQVNPTTIFPADSIGFCCDQIVQYVPSIDRFIWLLQGNNGFRLASASAATLASSGGTAWTYWNLPSTLFGQPTGTGVDYPDLSVGSKSLYLSWDVGWPTCPKGCRSGLQVSRTSLSGIKAGGTISIDYTNPADSTMAWGSHVMQDTGGEVFWAGHNSNSQMRIFSLAEGSNTYFWRDVGISTWANNVLSSTTPDGQDWLSFGAGFPGNAVLGSTRVGNRLWFAWSAGTDRTFKQPHIEMVQLDRSSNFSKVEQVQIWNSSYGFAYPALATNNCTREVGLSFEFGGGGNYENMVVGFWGDFVAYITTASNVGTTRFGDYASIRDAPSTNANPGNLFTAFGYGLKSVPPLGAGTMSDVHYVLFGRPSSSCGGG